MSTETRFFRLVDSLKKFRTCCSAFALTTLRNSIQNTKHGLKIIKSPLFLDPIHRFLKPVWKMAVNPTPDDVYQTRARLCRVMPCHTLTRFIVRLLFAIPFHRFGTLPGPGSSISFFRGSDSSFAHIQCVFPPFARVLQQKRATQNTSS